MIPLAGRIADAALQHNDNGDEWYWPTEIDMDFTIGSATSSHASEKEVPLVTVMSDAVGGFEQQSAFVPVLLGVFFGIVVSFVSSKISAERLEERSPGRTTYDSI